MLKTRQAEFFVRARFSGKNTNISLKDISNTLSNIFFSYNLLKITYFY